MAASTSSVTAEKLHDYRLDLKDHSSSTEGRDDEGDLDGFFYVPNFLSEHEEDYLTDKINSAPRPKWKELQARRLQYWGGQISTKQQTLIPEPLPDFLCSFPPLVERIKATGAFADSKHGEPNHCLINEYEPGQGIMPHEDGGAYYPAVATVSLGSHTLLDIYQYAERQGEDATEAKSREQEPRFSILQERRSLLITRGVAYRRYLHGIAERTEDDVQNLARVINKDAIAQADLREALDSRGTPLRRDTRLSLTFRDVEKVASNGLTKLLGKR